MTGPCGIACARKVATAFPRISAGSLLLQRFLAEDGERELEAAGDVGFIECFQGQTPVALAEFFSIGTQDERQVRVEGKRESERALKADLAPGRREQVGTSHDF